MYKEGLNLQNRLLLPRQSDPEILSLKVKNDIFAGLHG